MVYSNKILKKTATVRLHFDENTLYVILKKSANKINMVKPINNIRCKQKFWHNGDIKKVRTISPNKSEWRRIKSFFKLINLI